MNRRITAKLGEVFEISLDALASAGFSWAPAAPESLKVVEMIDSAWRGVDAEKVGESTRQVFRFRTIGLGEEQLRFEYKRPWEAASQDTRTFVVRVE
ncbi:MAG: hypothetical protein E6I08_13405 [Chloroflexi bacterium]|nr:MAG: hypothetical protein E6I08_13405 [Chloroflexota bacterium]